MRVLVASDKFKGSLTAPEACDAIAAGLREAAAGDALEIRTLPVADGGDGLARTLADALGGSLEIRTVPDALGDPVEAEFALVEGGRVAVIEMAEASGLAQLAGRELRPLEASTLGTGRLVRHAIDLGVGEIVLGIGGSATNDGGTGLAEALGFRFFDENGDVLTCLPMPLAQARAIERPAGLDIPPVRVACDVANPLLGPEGCTRVYGPQKGIAEEDFAVHEARLARLVELFGEEGRETAELPGAGAAGGLGFGAVMFLGARLVPGFELVADLVGLADAVGWADLVITGEGRLDDQSWQGKAPAGVARLAGKKGKRAAAFCGIRDTEATGPFEKIVEIRDPSLGVEENMARGAELLREAARLYGEAFSGS